MQDAISDFIDAITICILLTVTYKYACFGATVLLLAVMLVWGIVLLRKRKP